MYIKPIKRPKISDIIIEEIKKLIFEGRLEPGTKIPTELELAEQFSVGRASVREALKALETIGLIKRSRDGTFVNESITSLLSDPVVYKLIMSKISVKELLEARKVLEPRVIALAAKRRTAAELEAIWSSILEMEDAAEKDDPKLFVSVSLKAHRLLAQASHNQFFLEIFSVLIELSQQGLFVEKGIMKRSTDFHKRIFTAIKDQDPRTAEAVTMEHLQDVEDCSQVD